MEFASLFKNAKIQNWPDYWLVVSGVSLLIVLAGVAAGNLEASWLELFGGLFLFGIGAKIAHYRARDSNIPGNVWVSKWRHGLMADLFAIAGVGLVGLAAYQFWYA